jgi:hypothetical protein
MSGIAINRQFSRDKHEHALRVAPQSYIDLLISSNPLSTLLQRFACARLSQPCLPESCPDLSATLTTIAFDSNSLRWLEIST